MKSDPTLERKCVHLKIRRSVHMALRRLLLPRGLSMQEVFDAFAEEIVRERPGAVALLDRVALMKLKRQLGPLEPRDPNKPRRPVVVNGVDMQHAADQQDEDSLYALIQEGMDLDEDGPDDEDAGPA